MDIIYVVKKNSDNLELRFSLRSLQNIKHDRVFIIGHKPSWANGIIHIPHDDNGHKFDNVREKNRIILSLDIKDFIYMNDDFYFLEKQEVKIYKMGTLSNQMQYLEGKGYSSIYSQKIRNTLKIFPDGISYETHTPFIYNRKKLERLYKKYDTIPALRSVYGNEYGIDSVDIVSKNYISSELIKDCKCYNINQMEIIPGQQLFSSDNDIIGEEFKEFMLGFFPKKSKYELYEVSETVQARANYNITIEGVEYRKDRVYEISPDINVKNAFGLKDYFTIL